MKAAKQDICEANARERLIVALEQAVSDLRRLEALGRAVVRERRTRGLSDRRV